jgi:hypothetical protein
LLGSTSYTLLAQSGNPALAELANPYMPNSPAYAPEHLGWGLFFGLAAGFTSLSLRSGRSPDALAWTLVLAGALSLAHFLGVTVRSQLLIWLGFLAWAVFLPLASTLAARVFRRRLQRAA